jgi:hypothetical protein
MGLYKDDTIILNTSLYEDGTHILEIKAWDEAGNLRTWTDDIIINHPDITLIVLVGTGVLAGGVLLILWYRNERGGLALWCGVSSLVIAEVIIFGLMVLTGFDVNEMSGLFSSMSSIAITSFGVSYFVHKKLES